MAEPEVLLPDEWLEQHIQPGADTTCLRGHLEVYFPVKHPRAEEQYRKLYDAIATTFGGATAWDGYGAWCEENAPIPCEVHQLEKEPVRVITAAHNCTKPEELKRVVEAIKEAAEVTDQKSMAVRGTSRFYIIPRGEL